MVDLYKQYSKSILWNTIESFFYQLLLLAHQFALFSVVDRATYGLIGAMFSTTYLLVMVVNFGLDVSISAFFTYAIQSKKHFKKIMLFQLIPEYLLLTALCFIAAIVWTFLAQYSISAQLDGQTILLLGLLIIFEGSKKTLRSLLQLGFHSSKTACVEVITIIGYIGMVWIGYFTGHTINLTSIFLPLLIMSALSSFILLFFLMRYYHQLPDYSPAPLPDTVFQWRIIRSRFFNFLNQAMHALFSSNFLVPFFALTFGLAHAGILKLTASIAHCITSIVQKTFGISGAALLAHVKESSLEERQHAFATISNRLNQALCFFVIFFAINYSAIMHARSITENTTILTLAYLFLIIIFSENFFLAYEKFYIAHERADRLLLFNIIIMGSILALLSQAHTVSPVWLMAAIIGLRLIAFLCVMLFSFRQWHIKPKFIIHPSYIVSSLAISLTFFSLLR